MRKNTSFSLGEHFTRFVETQVGQGRYGSASDVVRAALRLLEEQEAKLEVLRSALIEGEESGPSTPFDFEAFIARKRGSLPPPSGPDGTPFRPAHRATWMKSGPIH
jgi:antitoxin ParD1/3/4